MRKYIILLTLVLPILWGFCSADTFTHKTKDIVYHGYATGDLKDGKDVVVTQEQGEIAINLTDYDRVFNTMGRNDTVSVLPVAGAIESEIITDAFVEALKTESAKGPFMILIEIDSPGGRVDLCKKMCGAISDTRHCPVVAYIKGGENGGAYSAAAALSLACDNIYMVPEVSIGAATMVAGHSGMKEIYGQTVGEKYDSAWRSYLATLAEQKGRSGALAKAMATKEIEVIEVKRNGECLYIEPKDKLVDDIVVRTLCKQNEILTLTAKEALTCHIADAIYESQQAVFAALNMEGAEVVPNESLANAQDEYEEVLKRYKKVLARIIELDSTIEYQLDINPLAARKTYPQLIKSLEYLLKMKQEGQDIPVNEQAVSQYLAVIKAQYEALRKIR